ncbi:MAG: DNA polymerase IV [Polyangiaceae bacterium]|nr:DNA polymerase IV [Polyangiaceae bacterium]
MPDGGEPKRKIIHIDMDAFYASVEQRDDPSLKGKPVAVGHLGPRGVVAAASYEARAFGVRSAMPSVRAARMCSDLIFVPPRFDAYREVSRQIHTIFRTFTDIVEPLSLDEAYLDVTQNHAGLASATQIAREIRRLIREQTGLTASAGVSYNKFIAKLASDRNKPDGLCVIRPEQGPDFVATLPVRYFHGIGPVTASKMESLGIVTGKDLRDKDLIFLQKHFGKSAHYYYWASRGRDDRPVEPHQERKSISVEDTFLTDKSELPELIEAVDHIAKALWQRMQNAQSYGRTLTLKIKFADFQLITRSKSLMIPIRSEAILCSASRDLLRAQWPLRMGARLLGLGVHNLEGTTPEPISGQLEFHWSSDPQRW